MKILLIGNHGQVGWELERTLTPLGEVRALDFPEIDLSDADGVRRLVREARPEVIVNAAAYTAVDLAESEPELALAVNGIAPGILASEAKAIDACLVHYSTDYVFDGQKAEPYVETDLPNPISVYGKTKLAGEEAIQNIGGSYLIFRTSWVYSLRADTFVARILRWARERDVLQVVDDQVGSPTWARLLAEITAQILAKASPSVPEWGHALGGLYHVAGAGAVSRFAWAQAILQLAPLREEGLISKLQPAKTSDFPVPAERPQYSALDSGLFQKLFGLCLPAWHRTLKLAVDDGQR